MPAPLDLWLLLKNWKNSAKPHFYFYMAESASGGLRLSSTDGASAFQIIPVPYHLTPYLMHLLTLVLLHLHRGV